jgi:hypothetical protein
MGVEINGIIPVKVLILIYRQIDIVSSKLIKVMISRRKAGRRAISVLWLY